MKPFDHIVRFVFAAIWLANGLWCKVMDGVPRHREIIGRILGSQHAYELTRVIGCAEIVFAVWIASGVLRRWSAATQIIAVLAMNAIEFTLAPELLFFGRLNLLVAFAYCTLVAAIELRIRPVSPAGAPS